MFPGVELVHGDVIAAPESATAITVASLISGIDDHRIRHECLRRVASEFAGSGFLRRGHRAGLRARVVGGNCQVDHELGSVEFGLHPAGTRCECHQRTSQLLRRREGDSPHPDSTCGWAGRPGPRVSNGGMTKADPHFSSNSRTSGWFISQSNSMRTLKSWVVMAHMVQLLYTPCPQWATGGRLVPSDSTRSSMRPLTEACRWSRNVLRTILGRRRAFALLRSHARLWRGLRRRRPVRRSSHRRVLRQPVGDGPRADEEPDLAAGAGRLSGGRRAGQVGGADCDRRSEPSISRIQVSPTSSGDRSRAASRQGPVARRRSRSARRPPGWCRTC